MPTTRTALISAAAALLDGGGPEAVTLRSVGHLAGVSHNAPYRHFKDREALLAAVAARELARRNRTPQPKGKAVERLERMAKDYIAWAVRYPARFKLVYGAWSQAYPELLEAAAETRARFAEAVRAAQGEKALAAGAAEKIAGLILALAHGAADLALAGQLQDSGADALLDDLLALLKPKRGLLGVR